MPKQHNVSHTILTSTNPDFLKEIIFLCMDDDGAVVLVQEYYAVNR